MIHFFSSVEWYEPRLNITSEFWGSENTTDDELIPGIVLLIMLMGMMISMIITLVVIMIFSKMMMVIIMSKNMGNPEYHLYQVLLFCIQ